MQKKINIEHVAIIMDGNGRWASKKGLKRSIGHEAGIKNCIKITGYVNSTDTFIDQPKIINPASEALSLLFGDSGKHARAAVSANSLPLGVAVEIDAIFEI